MSGRLATAVWSHKLPESRRLAFAGRTGLVNFTAAVDARVRYRIHHGRSFRPPLYQGDPRLAHIGRHIDDYHRRKAYIIKTYNLTKRKLRNLLPHLVQKGKAFRQSAPTTVGQYRRISQKVQFPNVPIGQRAVFFNWRKGDEVRLVPGGILAAGDRRIGKVDGTGNRKINKDGSIDYTIYTIKTANPKNNTCTLEHYTRKIPNKIPLDRNKTQTPLGGLQDSRFRDEHITVPLANVQLSVPRKHILASLKREGVELTPEQLDQVPERVYAVKTETRNVIAPDHRAKIRTYEKRSLDPLSWRPDEPTLAGKAKVFTWERWVTETEPAMHPSVRVDINVPIAPPQARKIPAEFAPPGYEQPSNPLATPSAVVLNRTWYPSYLHALGPSLDLQSNEIPNAYTDSLVSASAYIASSYRPGSLSETPPAVLTPARLAEKDEFDAALSKGEREERRAQYADRVAESQRALAEWTEKDNVWKTEVAAESLDPTLPMEYYAHRELANYYSTPAQDKRYAARRAFEKLEKEAFIDEAVKEHRHREDRVHRGLEPRVGRKMSLGEVKLTAERRYAEFWVDRKHDRQLAKAAKLREKHGPSKSELKSEKRAIKKAGLADRLRAVTLSPKKNQVIPLGLEKLILPQTAAEIGRAST